MLKPMASPRNLILVCLVGRTVMGSRVRATDVLSRKKNIARVETKECSELGWKMGTSRDANMAHMAIGIYPKSRKDIVKDFEEGVDWNLELVGDTSQGKDKTLGGRDYFGIYRRDQECVLTIAGSANTGDWINDFQFVHYDMPYCGITGVHYGFFSQWSDTIWSDVWEEKFVPFFNANCTDGISVVGHSLGGAVASVMATCAHTMAIFPDEPTHDASPKMTRKINITWLDKQNQKHFTPSSLPLVSELWTFGAPGIATGQVTNQSASDAILQGKRFFMDDDKQFDPVPFSGHLTKLQHPNMTAVNLYRHKAGYCTEEHWGPGTYQAAWAPDTMKLPNANFHSYNYEPRVADAFG